jgi:hypothetical protein
MKIWFSEFAGLGKRIVCFGWVNYSKLGCSCETLAVSELHDISTQKTFFMISAVLKMEAAGS